MGHTGPRPTNVLDPPPPFPPRFPVLPHRFPRFPLFSPVRPHISSPLATKVALALGGGKLRNCVACFVPCCLCRERWLKEVSLVLECTGANLAFNHFRH